MILICEKLTKLGYNTYFYGTEHSSEAPNLILCTKYINVMKFEEYPFNSNPRIYNSGEYLCATRTESNKDFADKIKEFERKFDTVLMNKLKENTQKDDVIFLCYQVCCYFQHLTDVKVINLFGFSGIRDWHANLTNMIFAYRGALEIKRDLLPWNTEDVFKITTDRWKVIGPPIDFNCFIFNDKPRDPSGPYLYLARIQNEKGMTGFMALAKHLPYKKFTIAGEGKYENGILTSTSFYSCEINYTMSEYPNVQYVGFADAKKRAELLSSATALIQLSEYDEPFGLNVIEANISGTPALTSDFGAFTETVTNGVNGYRVPRGLKWNEGYSSIFDKLHLINPEKCRVSAMKYHVDIVVPELVKYSEEVASTKIGIDFLDLLGH